MLYDTITQIIEDARASVYRTANFTMVKAYWHIGKAIVEEEQNGKERAEYGTELIKHPRLGGFAIRQLSLFGFLIRREIIRITLLLNIENVYSVL